MRARRSSSWRIEAQEYEALCAYLGLSPQAPLYERLAAYLDGAPMRFPRPGPFSLFLTQRRLSRWRIARLDLATRLFIPDHPLRHALNGVIALHECDPRGYRELSESPQGWRAVAAIVGGLLGFAGNLALTLPWLGWQLLFYVILMPFHGNDRLAGRRVLVTGVGHGLGRDLMRHCLDHGAEVIGTVRTVEAAAALAAELPPGAAPRLVVADLAQPGTLVGSLAQARIDPSSIDIAILCAAVKYDGRSVLSLPELRETFEVNLFSIVEFARWLCAAAPQRGLSATTAIVLVSSMGRWHGMHFSCGYNASKAALSIWGESLEMELRQRDDRRFTVTVVEPGLFASGMTRPSPWGGLLLVSRRDVAHRIVSAALAGRRSIRPPFWFAALTWGVCLLGRDARYRLFARARPRADRQ